jgi:hypothetical protein
VSRQISRLGGKVRKLYSERYILCGCLSDTDVVLEVQWMITLGKITTNYQTLEMGFRDHDGKKVVLRAMSTGAPRTVSTKRMERIFRHGEVAYVAECLITTRKDSEGRQQYHTKIKGLLGRHQQVFEAIPPGRPPDRGFEHTIELEEGAKPMISPPIVILGGSRMR